MSNIFGGKDRNQQKNIMNQMVDMAGEQLEFFQGERAEQKEVLEQQRKQFESFKFENPFADVKNPYADLKTEFENLYEGMENPYEDLTVNMRAAEFQAEQGNLQRANILQSLRGAAGASGVASLAQSLANQGAAQAEQISANIAQQEAANRRLAAQGEMSIRQMELQGAERARALGVSREQLVAQGGFQADTMRRQGEAAVQQAEFGKESTLLGVEFGLMAGANAALSQAMANQMSAMGMQANAAGQRAGSKMGFLGDLISTGASIYLATQTGGASGATGMSDRRLKKNINKIGESPSGLNIYSFEYINSKYGKGLFQGVMSNEVPKEAVVKMKNGYDAVNYGILDVEFKQI